MYKPLNIKSIQRSLIHTVRTSSKKKKKKNNQSNRFRIDNAIKFI